MSAVHLLAIACVLFSHLPGWAHAGLTMLLLCNLARILYLHVWGSGSWLSFVLNEKNVRVKLRGGKTLEGVLARQMVVVPWCVVLCVISDGSRRPQYQVIMADAMSVDVFRALRVRLRFI